MATRRVTEKQLAVLRLAKDGRSLYTDVPLGGKPGRSNTISTLRHHGLLERGSDMTLRPTIEALRLLERGSDMTLRPTIEALRLLEDQAR